MRHRTIEWVFTGICATLTVVVCVTAALLLSRGSDDAAANTAAVGSISPTTSTAPDPSSSVYHLDHIADSCGLIDLAPFTVYQPLDPGNPPQHTETKGDDPTLYCRIQLAEFGSVTLSVRDSVTQPRATFDSSREVFQTPNPNLNEQAGTVPGLGAENFFVAGEQRNTYYADDVSVNYKLVVLDADVTVDMAVTISAFNRGLTTDAIARPVQDQVRAILTRLRR